MTRGVVPAPGGPRGGALRRFGVLGVCLLVWTFWSPATEWIVMPTREACDAGRKAVAEMAATRDGFGAVVPDQCRQVSDEEWRRTAPDRFRTPREDYGQRVSRP